jgi:drug/metabolite transporter (DMT)-like permease
MMWRDWKKWEYGPASNVHAVVLRDLTLADGRAKEMSNSQLYAAAVLIWGSTWLAIKFQLGAVPPTVSVVWRFGLAGLILLAYAVWKKLPLRFSTQEHARLALLGLLMFGVNYVLVYLSEVYLTSGLVAVIFSLYVFFNIVAMRIFFGKKITSAAMLSALLGVGGVVLIFWPEFAQLSTSSAALTGLMLALAATVTASLASMVATENHHRNMPVLQVNAWAMLYGAGFVAAYAAFTGDEFAFDWSFSYVASLLYLSLFGSVLAFGAYLTLMRRIGADRAGYTAVAIPVVALLLSTLFENLTWQIPMVVGVMLVMAGNVLMLRHGASHG